MDLFPTMQTSEFEKLEPGELFLFLDDRERFFAIKTAAGRFEPGERIAVIGPNFKAGNDEPFLLAWPSRTILSYGRDFSVVPSAAPEDWSYEGAERGTASVAIAGDQSYSASMAPIHRRHTRHVSSIFSRERCSGVSPMRSMGADGASRSGRPAVRLMCCCRCRCRHTRDRMPVSLPSS
jgi:hypothetical protein